MAFSWPKPWPAHNRAEDTPDRSPGRSERGDSKGLCEGQERTGSERRFAAYAEAQSRRGGSGCGRAPERHTGPARPHQSGHDFGISQGRHIAPQEVV